MKNIIKSLALAAVVLVSGASFTACKKGENDPGISLKSRKGRFVGEWKLSSGEEKETIGGNTTTYTYTESQVTVGIGGSSVSGPYSQSLTIEKDGTYTQTITSGTTVTAIKGRWMFSGKNKDAELKNKEAVIMTETERVSTNPGGTTTTTTTNPVSGNLWAIDQLKNDEMIVKYVTSTSGSGSTTTNDVTLTYVTK